MPDVLDPADLSTIGLFQGLATSDLARLHDVLQPRIFAPAATIMLVDEPGNLAYIIVHGTIKIQAEQAGGANVILAILRDGEVLGEMSLMDNVGRSASAVTTEESLLLSLDRATFWECLRTMPPMTYNLARVLSRRLRFANQQIQALASLDVHGRVARQILTLAQEFGETGPNGSIVIPLRLTQNDLADMVGASRVRVNHVMVSFTRRDFISVDDQNHLVISDREALRQVCYDSY